MSQVVQQHKPTEVKIDIQPYFTDPYFSNSVVINVRDRDHDRDCNRGRASDIPANSSVYSIMAMAFSRLRRSPVAVQFP